MGVRFDTLGDFLNRVASTPPNNAAFTFMGWFYISVDLAANGTFMFLGDATTVNATAGVDTSGGGTPAYRLVDTDFGGVTTSSLIAVGAWHHVAWVRTAGAVHTLYIDGVLEPNTNGATTTLAAASPELRIGDNVTSDRYNGRVEAAKFWTAALTQPQIAAEMARYDPVVTANNWAWWPLTAHTDLTDHSVNVRHFTGNGTLSTEAGPGGITDGSGGGADPLLGAFMMS